MKGGFLFPTIIAVGKLIFETKFARKTTMIMKNPLPVSKKAYTDFSLRIADTLADHSELAREALTLLDTYLNAVSASATADDAIAAASDIVRIVFTLIRPEIDRAVSRSARARSRRAKQRQQSDPTVSGDSPTPRNAAKPMERLSAISIPAFVKQRCPAESEAGFINKVAVDFSEVLPEISDKPKPPRIIRRCIERAMRRLS